MCWVIWLFFNLLRFGVTVDTWLSLSRLILYYLLLSFRVLVVIIVEMVRQRVQIKKIDSLTARQVTFSKRRKGLFKKARELTTLCDAEIALIVFSATGKLFEYSSSSMKETIERHKLQAQITQKNGQSPLQLQVENHTQAILSKEIVERTIELRRMMGEELQGLDIEGLMKLEKLLEGGLSRILKSKVDKILEEINDLKRKEAQLVEKNLELRLQAKMIDDASIIVHACEGGHSSSPLEDGSGSDISLELGLAGPQDGIICDVALKLGLPLPN